MCSTTFPMRLFTLLEHEDQSIVGWIRNGTAFKVFDNQRFSDEILSRYYKHKKVESFQRQLNIYGFKRINKGEDMGAYYHSQLIRGRRELVRNLKRIEAPRRIKNLNVLETSLNETDSEAGSEFEQKSHNYSRSNISSTHDLFMKPHKENLSELIQALKYSDFDSVFTFSGCNSEENTSDFCCVDDDLKILI